MQKLADIGMFDSFCAVPQSAAQSPLSVFNQTDYNIFRDYLTKEIKPLITECLDSGFLRIDPATGEYCPVLDAIDRHDPVTLMDDVYHIRIMQDGYTALVRGYDADIQPDEYLQNIDAIIEEDPLVARFFPPGRRQQLYDRFQKWL